MSKIKNLLVDEFSSQLEEVSKMEVGTDKYKTAVDGVTKLADRIIEIEKLEQAETESGVKWEAQNMEHELKAIQMKDEKHDRLIRNGIEGLKIVGGAGLAVWALIMEMKFEDKGLIPSMEGGRTALKSLFKFMK